MKNKYRIIKRIFEENGLFIEFKDNKIFNCELINKNIFTKNNHYNPQFLIKCFKERNDGLLYSYSIDKDGNLKLDSNNGDSINKRICCINYLYPDLLEDKFTEFENKFNKKHQYTDLKNFLNLINKNNIDKSKKEIEKHFSLIKNLYMLIYINLFRDPNYISENSLLISENYNSYKRSKKIIDDIKFENKNGNLYKIINNEQIKINKNDIEFFAKFYKIIALSNEIDKISNERIDLIKENMFKEKINNNFTKIQYKKWIISLYYLLNDIIITEDCLGEFFNNCHGFYVDIFNKDCVFMAKNNMIYIDNEDKTGGKMFLSLSKNCLVYFDIKNENRNKPLNINVSYFNNSNDLDFLKCFNRGLINKNKKVWGCNNNLEMFKNFI